MPVPCNRTNCAFCAGDTMSMAGLLDPLCELAWIAAGSRVHADNNETLSFSRRSCAVVTPHPRDTTVGLFGNPTDK